MTVQIPPPDGYDGPGETINEQAFWRRDTVEDFCRARVSQITVERDCARAQYEALVKAVADARAMTTAPLYDQAALEAARMAGVHSVHEQTAVIVRAALELLESIEGNEPFTAEKMRAFKRVFGA